MMKPQSVPRPVALCLVLLTANIASAAVKPMAEKQITTAAQNHILTNVNVWSHDGRWLIYDTRPDREGAVFEGRRIEMVNVESGEVRVLFEAQKGAFCGVAQKLYQRS